MFKVYDINTGGGFKEINLAIINEKNGKMILTDNEAVHSLHNINDESLITSRFTAKQILALPPVNEVEKLTHFVRHFGSRIETNYSKLLRSIKEIGLNPKDEIFKRSDEINPNEV
jgi:hypothetical protein